MIGQTGPDAPRTFEEFPKVVFYSRSGKYCVLGVRFDDEISAGNLAKLDEAGILVHWEPGPGVEPQGRWKEL